MIESMGNLTRSLDTMPNRKSTRLPRPRPASFLKISVSAVYPIIYPLKIGEQCWLRTASTTFQGPQPIGIVHLLQFKLDVETVQWLGHRCHDVPAVKREKKNGAQQSGPWPARICNCNNLNFPPSSRSLGSSTPTQCAPPRWRKPGTFRRMRWSLLQMRRSSGEIDWGLDSRSCRWK